MKRNIVLIIAACVFLFSAYQLFTIFREYNKGTQEYEQIQETVVKQVIDGTEPDEEKEEQNSEKKKKKSTGRDFWVDFKTLKDINEDAVAWIRFDEPEKISYPIVHTDDNSTYLSMTITGQKNSAGTLFIDMNNVGDFSDKNTFIYGHNMKNGSMFGRLREYKSFKFYKKYPYFYIYTPDGKVRTYQVFATEITESNSFSYQIQYTDGEEFKTYIEKIRASAIYNTVISVEESDQIVSLSTCTNVTETQRMIVHGVLISIEDIK